MNESLPSPEEAIRILREIGCSPEVMKHCKAVAKLAIRTAKKCMKNGININIQLVHIGALLHDIGRSQTHSVHHGVIGAEIAQSLNLPLPIILIIERHIGGGITSEEASKLGWPSKSYMPKTFEEKIIAYADKLIEGTKVVPIEETIKQLKEELGADHPAVKRVTDLHREISVFCQEKVN